MSGVSLWWPFAHVAPGGPACAESGWVGGGAREANSAVRRCGEPGMPRSLPFHCVCVRIPPHTRICGSQMTTCGSLFSSSHHANSQGLHPGYQAWQQMILASEPPHWPNADCFALVFHFSSVGLEPFKRLPN